MRRNKPYVDNSWEYLSEHLYQKALKGDFSEDLVSLKAVLPSLRGLDHLKDLLKSLAQAGNRNEDEEVISDLIKLHQTVLENKSDKTPLMSLAGPRYVGPKGSLERTAKEID